MEPVRIGQHLVGANGAPYVIAELSANHGGKLEQALGVLRAAKAAGADAIKLQTYTADSMTLASDDDAFVVGKGTLWSGQRLYDLYAAAAMPLDWHGPLFAEARRLGLDCFSTPFDVAAVDFLEQFEPVAHKVASFELVDLDLIEYVASTGRPVVMSTGMADADEIGEAIAAARRGGAAGVVLLRCNSGYPAPVEEMDLLTIPDMLARWQVPVGLSDHTIGSTAALVAVALGACVIEKHLTLSREEATPDSAFSAEPAEFQHLVDEIRRATSSLGRVRYGPSPEERKSLQFRRSLWWVVDREAGEVVEPGDLRSLRPSGGVAPKLRSAVVGRVLRRPVRIGQPVALGDVGS